jgi:cytochrome P450
LTNNHDSLDQGLLSAEFLTDPYPFYHRLRAEEPVHWSDVWNGWVLTRYDDVVFALRDSACFSNVGRLDLFLGQLPQLAEVELKPLKNHFSRAITHLDPPDHTRLRALIKEVFTGRLVQSMRTRVQVLVDDLLAAVEASGSHRAEMIRDFAYPLPAMVIGELLGVPPADRDRYKKWSDDIGVGLFGTGQAAQDNIEQARQSLLELTDYLGYLVGQRRQHPQNDLITGFIGAEDHGDRLTEAELFSTCVTLLIAGHGTTTNLIGNGLVALLRHPDQWQTLKDNPALIAIAIEELLRYDSPLQRIWRLARQDVELNGQKIRQGQIVLPAMGAANRDPAEFPNPDQLDLNRRRNRHTAFGNGIHLCLGAPLARLQGAIAINTIGQRLPSLQLETETLAWEANLFHRGLKSLPVVF